MSVARDTRSFGDYVVYVDESGDHSLSSLDPQYPMFVLAFCIFPVKDYVNSVVPAVEQFKFDHFGHDMVILHEREIRKSLPPFDILLDATVRERFLSGLTGIIEAARFGVVACAITKRSFIQRRGTGTNPYHVALEYGLERVFLQLQQRKQRGRRVFVVFESRGKKEDEDLELEFRRIMATTKMRGMPETLEFLCVSKQTNSPGLQLADMVARPIGVKTLNPHSPNRAWDVILPKMPRSDSGNPHGFGLKVYP